MARPKLLILWCLLACLAALLVSLNGCSGTSTSHSTPPPAPGKIEHVIIIFQENRTPDNLFQDPVLIQRGADIQDYGYSLTTKVMLQPIDLGTNGPNGNPQNYDLSHAHEAFEHMYDGGAMDGAASIACSPAAQCPPNAHPAPQFMYVYPNDVQPYFALAEQYTFGDRMFQNNQGPSMPAHQYIIAGTSWAGTITPQPTTLFQAENPQLGPGDVGAKEAGENTGCSSPLNETVNMIDITQPWPANETTTMYPCWEHPTLMDVLDAQKISWKYYANICVTQPCAMTGIWVGPNAIQHMCHNSGTATGQPCDSAEWLSNVVYEQNVLTDISAGNLPSVSWVIPDGKASDHALTNDGEGPSWVASIVNAIGQSQYWNNTAIIITWDDWGGWYDHVAPPVSGNNSYEHGFRVPLIVVSPYAKAQYISHTPHDFGSILKFIEETFSLPAIDPDVTIGQTTGFADTNALDDLSDCFDYTQTPLTFQTIPSQYDAQHFLNDTRPPSDPDDD